LCKPKFTVYAIGNIHAYLKKILNFCKILKCIFLDEERVHISSYSPIQEEFENLYFAAVG